MEKCASCAFCDTFKGSGLTEAILWLDLWVGDWNSDDKKGARPPICIQGIWGLNFQIEGRMAEIEKPVCLFLK